MEIRQFLRQFMVAYVRDMVREEWLENRVEMRLFADCKGAQKVSGAVSPPTFMATSLARLYPPEEGNGAQQEELRIPHCGDAEEQDGGAEREGKCEGTTRSERWRCNRAYLRILTVTRRSHARSPGRCADGGVPRYRVTRGQASRGQAP